MSELQGLSCPSVSPGGVYFKQPSIALEDHGLGFRESLQPSIFQPNLWLLRLSLPSLLLPGRLKGWKAGELNEGHQDTQRLQYPLIKECTLNLIRVPIIVYGIFLNSGVLESLGSFLWLPSSG